MAFIPRDVSGYHLGEGRAPRLPAGQEGSDPTLPCPAAAQPREVSRGPGLGEEWVGVCRGRGWWKAGPHHAGGLAGVPADLQQQCWGHLLLGHDLEVKASGRGTHLLP